MMKSKLLIVIAALIFLGNGCADGVPEGCAEFVYGYSYVTQENNTYVTHRVEGYCVKQSPNVAK